MPRYYVNMTVAVYVTAEDDQAAASKAEDTVQRLLDRSAKRMKAVVGADYSNVEESPAEPKPGV